MSQTKKKKNDPLIRIKYVAYCTSQMPMEKVSFDDFVRYCKFQLAIKTNRLIKDPIWDSYTAEEILHEYYAHQFATNQKFKDDFELNLLSGSGVVDDFSNWADQQMKKERNFLKDLEEKIEFDPNDVLGE